MNRNFLLCTDVYKVGHMSQYPQGTTKIYSYLVARSDKKLPTSVFFGLQYYIKEFLSTKVTKEMVDEFLTYRKEILGTEAPEDMKNRLNGLVELGYLPLKIKAVEEGTVLPVKNVLMTITNTHPDHYWLVGFVESMLLKVWNTTTVASYSKTLKDLCADFSSTTCDDNGHLSFQVHDFGYRGCSSEETAAISGAAHLINFLGTDTIPAIKIVKEYYGGSAGPIGLSVPASEHSVMCSFGQENELGAFKNMLALYPSGIVSIVSDTYNLWNVLTNFVDTLKPEILARDGKVVFRPDSGDPEKIICGDPSAPAGSPENLGCLRILDQQFGSTVNSKGFKVLNPKVGLIYGDGMYFERFKRILCNMQEMGYAASNLVIGVGGLLLQQHSRDDMGFAVKATYAEVNGEVRELLKDPVTDHGKKSHKGLLTLTKNSNGEFVTKDGCTWAEEATGLLETVYENGVLVKEITFDKIRQNAKQ